MQTKKDQPETGHTTIPPRKKPPELMSWLPRLRVYRHTIEECLFSERLRGEVAHRAMEHLRVTGNDETDTNRALKMAMHDFPALAGLPRETLDDLERDISTMLRWALDNAQLRTWLARGNSEPEIMDNDGKFHRVDHLYMDEDMAVVVEFKTGHKYPEHHDQVIRYLDLLANMDSVPQKRSGVLVYLDLHEVEPVADARGE